MQTGQIPGPVYAIGTEPRPPVWEMFAATLVRCVSSYGEVVALFTSEQKAKDWLETFGRRDFESFTFKPFAFTETDEFLQLLGYLADRGDEYVAFNPVGSVVGVAPIGVLKQRIIGGGAPPGGR